MRDAEALSWLRIVCKDVAKTRLQVSSDKPFLIALKDCEWLVATAYSYVWERRCQLRHYSFTYF